MKRYFYILLSLCLSCISAPSYYVMNNANIPLLKKKNDLVGSINSGTSGFNANSFNVNTTSAHFSYALTNHLGLMLNGSRSWGMDIDTELGQFSHTWKKMYEVAIGYYRPIEFKVFHFNGQYISEYYCGRGFGHVKTDFNEGGTGKVYEIGKSNIRKYFFQTNHGYVTDYLEFGIAVRINHLDYYDFNKKMSDGSNLFQSRYKGYFLDFFVVSKIGPKNLKVYNSIGTSRKIYRHLPLKSKRSLISFGIELNLFKLIKDKSI